MLSSVANLVRHNARYWHRLERKIKEDEEINKREEDKKKREAGETARNPPNHPRNIVCVSRKYLENFGKLSFNKPPLLNSKL